MIERGHNIKALDHGYVRLVDWMGSDETIVEAARISTGRGFVSWEPYKRCKNCDHVAYLCGGDPGCDHELVDFPRGDLGILDYLYRNRHTTPFEMCELVLDVQVPMDCWRQWIRHRTASVNEYSTRYSEAIDLMAATAPDAWRTQGVSNRQGSGGFVHCGDSTLLNEPDCNRGGFFLSHREKELQNLSREVYEERLRIGVAKEQARKDLPLSTYTAARWKCDLKNVLGFLGLRQHSHAQIEIRTYANAVGEIVQALWPRTYALFEEYDLYGVRLSRTEARMLEEAIDNRAGEDPVLIALQQKLLVR